MTKENAPARGLLIVVEGIDGTGKTTLVDRLAKYCRAQKVECIVSREPTNGRWGMLLRQSAQTARLPLGEELELFMKDRAEHVERVIQPALSGGKIVLLDRYYFSTAAYQGARGADAGAIIDANEQFAPIPDLLLLLDASPETGRRRITRRGDQIDAFEQTQYQEEVRRIYLELKRPYLRVIDASRHPDAVWRDCLAHVTAALDAHRAAIGGK